MLPVRSIRNPELKIASTTPLSLLGRLSLMSIRARVSHGRLVVDEPVDLPEGTVLDLVIDDEEDELDEEERRALHARLTESAAPTSLGAARPIAMILDELRQSR